MSRRYALAMTRPHQVFGFQEPIGRQIPRGISGWAIVLLCAWVALAAVYILHVTRAAPRSDRLQRLERQATTLQREVTVMEDRAARASSMHTLTERAKSLGFVETSALQYLNPGSHAFVRR